MKREDIYKAIDSEREYQDIKWSNLHDENHSIGDWLLFIEVQLNEAKLNYYNNNITETINNMRKIAALVVAYGEQGFINERLN